MSATRARPASDLAYLCRALKAPSLADAAARLAERARADAWSHEEYLAACLEREVAARQSHGGEARIRAARLPSRKTLEDFDYDHQRSVRREVIAHLGALDFVEAKENVVFLGPPGTGKSHCETDHPVPSWGREPRLEPAAAGMTRKSHWPQGDRGHDPKESLAARSPSGVLLAKDVSARSLSAPAWDAAAMA